MGLLGVGWGAGGGKACNCGCSATICVRDCTGAAESGATVDVLSVPGGATVASGTTSGAGCVTLALPASGSYDVRITIGAVTGYERGVTLGCGGTPTYNANCCVEVDVKGCGVPFACGADVTITDPATGDVLATGATDATGSVILPLWTIPASRTISATAAPQASDIGYAGSDAAEITLPLSCSYPPNSGNTIAVDLAEDPDYVCCTGTGAMVPRHMTLTDPNGSLAFDYCEIPGVFAGWTACYAPTVAGTIQWDEYCSPLAPSASSCPVVYTGTCATDIDGTPTFTVQRSWNLAAYFHGGGYTPGYAGLTWDQCVYPAVRRPACLTDADGCHGIDADACTCSVCEGVGSEFTVSEGSGTFDPCSPFALSIASLAFGGAGLLVPACSDPPVTVPGDPVGGGVTIS